jgi:hypothetical protein
MDICPDCGSPLCRYGNNINPYHDFICWSCGFYSSDSPAFTKHPYLFKNMVRENPQYFISRFLNAISADVFLQRKRADGDFKEPIAETIEG